MIQFNAANEGLTYAGAPNGANDFSLSGLIRLDSAPSGSQTFLNLGSVSLGAALSFGMFNGGVYVYNWTSGLQVNGPTLSNGQEFWYGFTKSGDTGTLYWRVNGGSRSSANATIADQTYGSSLITIGRYDNSSDRLTGCHGALKIWDGTVLTGTQLDSEWQYRDAVVTSGLYANWRLNTLTADADGYNDRSGNGRNLSVTGTLGAVTDPSWILGNAPAAGGSKVPLMMAMQGG